MAVETHELGAEDLAKVTDMIEKGDALIRYHSKIRTDFLGLEMKIMQERTNIEQAMRETVKGLAEALKVENVESYEVDKDAGTLTLTTKDTTSDTETGETTT
jgi:hypothetical protein